ncbi:hypothetical protein CDL12_03615 [Handroanthus impetiginosus]|uniref:BHLH domain-containing protein n=1 Tax=Handroanthus impetiginosus TaxID=429701 RepID=A0A2G9I1N9_9LAMI|nr:hypothetical protein CDL12_03615 [Handroanthus impetiginosus]
MFPLRSDGLVLNQDPSFSEQDKFLEDLLADCGDHVEGNIEVISNKGIRKKQKTVQKSKGEPHSGTELKKIMHRDTERKRRKEMSGLYASLRSLLPLEYIKGKRSITDHIYQAESYIKHMQKKIERMQTKRDKLKEFSDVQRVVINIADHPMSSSSIHSCHLVKINPCRDGLEILITTSLNGEGFPLSKVITELVGRGLNVVSFISTRSVDEWFLYKVQIKVHDLARINLFELQERLINVIKFA